MKHLVPPICLRYNKIFDAMDAAGIIPNATLHHFVHPQVLCALSHQKYCRYLTACGSSLTWPLSSCAVRISNNRQLPSLCTTDMCHRPDSSADQYSTVGKHVCLIALQRSVRQIATIYVLCDEQLRGCCLATASAFCVAFSSHEVCVGDDLYPLAFPILHVLMHMLLLLSYK